MDTLSYKRKICLHYGIVACKAIRTDCGFDKNRTHILGVVAGASKCRKEQLYESAELLLLAGEKDNGFF